MSKFYNNVKTALLLGLMTALILWIGSFWGSSGVMVAFVMAAVMNFVSFFFSDKIALASMGAEEVGPSHKLYDITEGLARRANMPMPRVYVSPQQAPTRSPRAAGRTTRRCARRKGCCTCSTTMRSPR